MHHRLAFGLLSCALALQGAACLSSDSLDADGSGGEGAWSPGPAVTDGAGGGIEPCGDGLCDADEDCQTCAIDCACGPSCGDQSCDLGSEDCTTCPQDCGACTTCGDQSCDAGETCASCYEDCGICACMPDGLEPNNSSGTASPLSLGTDHCDLSICSTDVDWLAFSVAGPTSVSLTFSQGQGDLDLEIYSSIDLGYVSGSYSTTDDEAVALSGLPAGTYWARVYGKMGAENPAYCIRFDAN